jgi:hypothetical protein
MNLKSKIHSKLNEKYPFLSVEAKKRIANDMFELLNLKQETPSRFLNERDRLSTEPMKDEFTYYVKPCGHSSHIHLSRRWLDKFVNVKVEEIKE